jgi:dTDP-4-amino-4,6-dideoxygalactose transaminase
VNVFLSSLFTMVYWVPKKHINYDDVKKYLSESEKTNQFTNGGPVVKILENTVRSLLEIDESKGIVCVSNGTHALHAVVAAFELHENKSLKFVSQSFTFPASAQGYLKTVDIVDIDSEGGLDLSLVNDCSGIIVTNIFGNVVDIQKYTSWASSNNKYLIFDNAATSYTKYNGINSCNFGNASIISFHHTKPIGFGEGGCIIIDKKYEPYVRRVINFGFEKISIPIWNRVGSNYKMSDVQAAFILQYLSNFYTIVRKHKELTDYFKSKTTLTFYPNFSSETPFLSCFCVLTSDSENKLNLLLENGIFARKYYVPLVDTPVANKVYSEILCIPCTVDMSDFDIDKIIKLIE